MVASYFGKVEHFIAEKALAGAPAAHDDDKGHVVSGVSLEQAESLGSYEGIVRSVVQGDELDDFSGFAGEERG